MLVDGKIEVVQSDNGSEFVKLFKEACGELGIEHTFLELKLPKKQRERKVEGE